MGHTQLKTGLQVGHVEHRGEIEVKAVQKEEKKIFGPSTPPENRPSCLTKKALRGYLRTT
jgi:hypothetical protein